MTADKLLIDRGKDRFSNGKVQCPMMNCTVKENTCMHCKFLRIAEYNYIRCLYRAIKEAETKTISI